jgi:hypothetical protein
VVGARVALAEAMGVDADTIANAPLAAESLRDDAENDSGARRAVRDRRAVAARRAGAGLAPRRGQVLEEGALVNAKPRLDLFAKAGWAPSSTTCSSSSIPTK